MCNDTKLNVGIIGGFQKGKSTFVNCILDDLVARTGGEGVCVTSVNVKYVYDEVQSVTYCSGQNVVQIKTLNEFLKTKEFAPEINEVRVCLWKPILRYVNIIDTPGFNANEKDTATAISSLDKIDVAVIVVNNEGLSMFEIEIMSQLTERGIPFFVIMNCHNRGGDSWNPYSNFNVEKEKAITAAMINHQFDPQKIEADKFVVSANFQWFWYSSEQYLQEEKGKQTSLLDEINFYIKKQNESIDRDFFREKSNLLTVRRFFDDEHNWGFPRNCIRWKSELIRVFSVWENQLKKILK